MRLIWLDEEEEKLRNVQLVKGRRSLTDLRMLVSSNKNKEVQARTESFLHEAGHLTDTAGSSKGKAQLPSSALE